MRCDPLASACVDDAWTIRIPIRALHDGGTRPYDRDSSQAWQRIHLDDPQETLAVFGISPPHERIVRAARSAR